MSADVKMDAEMDAEMYPYGRPYTAMDLHGHGHERPRTCQWTIVDLRGPSIRASKKSQIIMYKAPTFMFTSSEEKIGKTYLLVMIGAFLCAFPVLIFVMANKLEFK